MMNHQPVLNVLIALNFVLQEGKSDIVEDHWKAQCHASCFMIVNE